MKQPCFVVFDIPLLNGVNLCGRPLSERLRLLRESVREVPGVLHLAERSEARDVNDLLAAANNAIDCGLEGLVLKNPSSLYLPEARKKDCWVKWKPDFMDQLQDDFDAVVVGGYYGHGRRGGMLSSFVCAVAEPVTQPGAQPTHLRSFVKVGGGFTADVLAKVNAQLGPFMFDFRSTDPRCARITSNIKFPTERPDKIIDPSDSIVLQIKATEIQATDKFPTGITLRFPRLVKVRPDKSWDETLTFRELEEMFARSRATAGRLADRQATSDTKGDKRGRMTAGSGSGALVRGVNPEFAATNVSGVAGLSAIFSGYSFVVVVDRQQEKVDIETLIAQHGGKITSRPTEDTRRLGCIFASRLTYRVTAVNPDLAVDVVLPSWLHDCINQVRILPLLPHYLLAASPQTRADLRERVDSSGDSFTENLTLSDFECVWVFLFHPLPPFIFLFVTSARFPSK